MSRLHRSASAQMSRPAISIQNERRLDVRLAVGADDVLPRVRASSRASSPRWTSACRTTIRSRTATGRARRPIMRAEAAFMQGRFADAHIALERAYAQIDGNGQENMALCCDFLARRLSLHARRSRSATASSSGARRCWGCIASRGSTFCKASCAYYYALLVPARKNPCGLRASISSPPSTFSRPESR